MLSARVHGMVILKVFTIIIGGTTLILAAITLLMLPHRLLMVTHLNNLTMSMTIMSIGMGFASGALSRAMSKKDLLPQNRMLVGIILLFGMVTGIFLVVMASGSIAVFANLEIIMAHSPQTRLDPALLQRDSPQIEQPTSTASAQDFEKMDQESKLCDLRIVRIMWTVIHGLYAVNGMTILISTTFAAVTWSQKGNSERDREREPLLIGRDGPYGDDDISQSGKIYKRHGPLNIIVSAA